MKALFLATLLTVPLLAQRSSDSPLNHLPKNVEVISYFGERADFSPDNKRIAFMDKSFGDAFVMDLATRQIRCVTCSIPGAAFLRIMHLANGDYILIGPAQFKDINTSRRADNELWYMSAKPGSKPVRMGVKLSEGAALSKKSMKISFSELPAQFPEMPKTDSRLVVADFDLSGETPKLTNRKVVYESHTNKCNIEAQDFYDNDTKMTFTCYQRTELGPNDDILAAVYGIDLATGKVTDFSKAPGTYNEVEGILPDGKHTLVEGDRHVEELGGRHGSHNIDIYNLTLDGTGKEFVRLTNFNDFEGWKSSNPVVSTDGKLMAFQIAKTADEAGVGYGLLLYRF